MTKFMIVNAYGRSNRGDSVLLDECIHDIREYEPSAEIAGAVFEGIETISERHPDVDWSERIGNSKNKSPLGRFRALLVLFSGLMSSTKMFRFLEGLIPSDQRKTLHHIRNSSVVLSAPGGYINDVNLAYYISLYHIWLANVLGKRVILAPQSIGPISSNFGRRVARHVLNQADITCARESYSYGFLTELGVDARRILRTGDSAFWNFEVTDNAAAVEAEFARLSVPSDKGIFGMTVVDWGFPGSRDPAGDATRYAAAMAKIADTVSETHGLQPVIFNQVREDLPMSRRVRELAQHHIVLDELDHEPELLRAMIARSTFFLGTRFHSCIFALMASRPTIAISYLPKTTYIMEDLRLMDRVSPIEAVETKRILGRISVDLADLSRTESEIASAVTTYREQHMRLPEVLEKVLGGQS